MVGLKRVARLLGGRRNSQKVLEKDRLNETAGIIAEESVQPGWFYWKSGALTGPFDDAEMFQLLEDGELQKTSLVTLMNMPLATLMEDPQRRGDHRTMVYLKKPPTDGSIDSAAELASKLQSEVHKNRQSVGPDQRSWFLSTPTMDSPKGLTEKGSVMQKKDEQEAKVVAFASDSPLEQSRQHDADKADRRKTSPKSESVRSHRDSTERTDHKKKQAKHEATKCDSDVGEHEPSVKREEVDSLRHIAEKKKRSAKKIVTVDDTVCMDATRCIMPDVDGTRSREEVSPRSPRKVAGEAAGRNHSPRRKTSDMKKR